MSKHPGVKKTLVELCRIKENKSSSCSMEKSSKELESLLTTFRVSNGKPMAASSLIVNLYFFWPNRGTCSLECKIFTLTLTLDLDLEVVAVT
ncbi:hypothetical protein BpHYR1_036150 [Brachionus plicatilis]|uniref:Uncharacterized protein n=1 Tax=Brachionus plicatilis TaxID=10195 RepID=A0A3M7PEU7_BRAPC|nr:hypothetical protein BpHYR1_036150 [Brachionus plicatilis]